MPNELPDQAVPKQGEQPKGDDSRERRRRPYAFRAAAFAGGVSTGFPARNWSMACLSISAAFAPLRHDNMQLSNTSRRNDFVSRPGQRVMSNRNSRAGNDDDRSIQPSCRNAVDQANSRRKQNSSDSNGGRNGSCGWGNE